MNALRVLALALIAAHLMCLPASAQVSQEVLESISTPDQVETSIGTLRFLDGAPYPETAETVYDYLCLLYTSPSPRDRTRSRMPSSA